MALFSRRSATPTGEFHAWATARSGIEAYLEPTNTQHPLSLLLVAGDGESFRRPIGSAKAARAVAAELDVPIYDVLAVGYPRRMREYAARGKARTAPPSRPAAPAFNPAHVAVLAKHAGIDGTPTVPDRRALEKLWKLARAKAHPDRNDGDRTDWDAVENAARALGLAP